VRCGVLTTLTKLEFSVKPGADIMLAGKSVKGGAQSQSLFDANFSFDDMGIGGLGAQFEEMFRRAFISRIFPPEEIQKLGISHTKGMMLYGPPGTGKTLMAREIGKMLNGQEPKIVNGPEIMSKFVGESEENVRKLFEVCRSPPSCWPTRPLPTVRLAHSPLAHWSAVLLAHSPTGPRSHHPAGLLAHWPIVMLAHWPTGPSSCCPIAL
jgi:hypothetical protein